MAQVLTFDRNPTGLGFVHRVSFTHRTRGRHAIFSAVYLSHASLIGTQEIFDQQHAQEEHGTVPWQPCEAMYTTTVGVAHQAARPAAEPFVDDGPKREPSSPAQRVASPVKADLWQHNGATANSSTATTTTMMHSAIAVPRGRTDPRLHAALGRTPSVATSSSQKSKHDSARAFARRMCLHRCRTKMQRSH